MKQLCYKVACKSCLKTDGVEHLLMIMDEGKDFYENRVLKSEYQLGNYLKSYSRKNNKTCQFCNSNNLEFTEIEFDSKKALYVPRNSRGQSIPEQEQFILVLSKLQNGQIEIQTGGSKYLPAGFKSAALKLIENAISIAPHIEFEEKSKGSVRFVVATGYINDNNHRTNRLEQFTFVGFSKEPLLEIVSLYQRNIYDSF